MICEKFSTESWSNCMKDKRSHRVSTDDYDCHSADTEKDSELKKTAIIQLQERKQGLTKSKEHTYRLFMQEVWCKECQIHHC